MRHSLLLALTLILTLSLAAPALAERGHRGHQDGHHQGYDHRGHGEHGHKHHHRKRHHQARRHHDRTRVVERTVIVREGRRHHSGGVPLVTVDGYPLVTLGSH